MLLPGTQMHILTFVFICIEIVILFYLLIYRATRPNDKIASLNIVLIFLLICYNTAGGLLPDQNLPGSAFVQNVIAYSAGFLTPCFFPLYVYKAFGLTKIRFHAYRGVQFFLIIPCIIFVLVYYISGNLDSAKNVLFICMLYGFWVIYSLGQAIKFKYKDAKTYEFREELTILNLSIASWIGVPIIVYFNLGQAAEALVTNLGFLMLFGFQMKQHIANMRDEHQRLINSEKELTNWNTKLVSEVNRRTRELEKITEQKTNTFVNLAHETKTPLTLINNYLDDYISKNGNSEELSVVKKNIDKLTTDIVNFFDLERFDKGFSVYNHDVVSNFSEILEGNLILFRKYSSKRNITIYGNIQENIMIKADPVAIERIVKNLIENAIKFSEKDCEIQVSLSGDDGNIAFSVLDCGPGIPTEMHNKIFRPYYQINNQKRSIQGMGLGLPIVRKILQDLDGSISVISDPQKEPGTNIIVTLPKYFKKANEAVTAYIPSSSINLSSDNIELEDRGLDPNKESIFIVEDNSGMVTYLTRKLRVKYNVVTASNGNEALKKLNALPVVPDLIISDVMMDKVDGFAFAKIISNDSTFNHVPFLFLSAKSTMKDRIQGLSLGAMDFIHKPFKIAELMKKIESILATVDRQKQALMMSAVEGLNRHQNQQPKNGKNLFEQNCKAYNLTSREQEIAKLIKEGYQYKVIGEKLHIAERTVSTHVQNIFEKVEVTNKVELINKLGGN